MEIPTLDLDALHAGIINDFKTAFPSFPTIDVYEETRTDLVIPALLIELEEWEDEPDADFGTDQQPVLARFAVRIVLPGICTRAAKLAARKAAAAIMSFLDNKRWSDPANPGGVIFTGPAKPRAGHPDHFDPKLDQFEVWRVEWEQVLWLGDCVWNEAGSFAPTKVFLGGPPPDIGPNHVADYQEVV